MKLDLSLFWDVDFNNVDFEKNSQFIINRGFFLKEKKKKEKKKKKKKKITKEKKKSNTQ